MPARTALELLEPEDRVKPLPTRLLPSLYGGGMGLFSVMAMHYGSKRPIYSGFLNYVIGVTLGLTIMNYISKKRDEYHADRDAVYRHYVQLHPEDFIMPEPKKIAEILEEWYPVR